MKNAASSEVEGVEVDWLFQMTDAIRVGVNAAYLDATYGDFRDGPCDAIALDADPACGTTSGVSIQSDRIARTVSEVAIGRIQVCGIHAHTDRVGHLEQPVDLNPFDFRRRSVLHREASR